MKVTPTPAATPAPKPVKAAASAPSPKPAASAPASKPKPSSPSTSQAAAGAKNVSHVGTADSLERQAKGNASSPAKPASKPAADSHPSSSKPKTKAKDAARDDQPKPTNTSTPASAPKPQDARDHADAGAPASKPRGANGAPSASAKPKATPVIEGIGGGPTPADAADAPTDAADVQAARAEIEAQLAAATPGTARVVTINIHKLVPASLTRTDRRESMAALRDTAAWIRGLDADVIVLQEVDEDRDRRGKPGVSNQLTRLAKLVNASDSAMAAAYDNRHGDRYDNAIITRNGFEIAHNYSADLPDPKYAFDRALGVADVRTPDGQQLTVMYTHTTTRRHQATDWEAQLDAIGTNVQQVLTTGELHYRDSLTGARHVARGLSTTNVVLAGDFNARATRVYDALGNAPMHNVIDDPEIAADAARETRARVLSHDVGRIDHIFVTHGMDVENTFVSEVTPVEVQGDDVTDHRGVVADVRLT